MEPRFRFVHWGNQNSFEVLEFPVHPSWPKLGNGRLEKTAPRTTISPGNPIRARRSSEHLTSANLSSTNLEHLSGCSTNSRNKIYSVSRLKESRLLFRIELSKCNQEILITPAAEIDLIPTKSESYSHLRGKRLGSKPGNVHHVTGIPVASLGSKIS